MNIRKATINDLNKICDLNNELFELEIANYDSTLVREWPYTKYGIEYFTDMINNDYVIIAEDDDSVVGFLAGSINKQKSYELVQYGEIDCLYIKEEYRGKGIGKKFIDTFKEYCKSYNVDNFKVVASFKNKKAINFYHKMGFCDFDLTLTINTNK